MLQMFPANLWVPNGNSTAFERSRQEGARRRETDEQGCRRTISKTCNVSTRDRVPQLNALLRTSCSNQITAWGEDN